VTAVVADTHSVLWYLAADTRLSAGARSALESATGDGWPIFVPTMCLVEATYLAEKGRIAGSDRARLSEALRIEDGALVAQPLTMDVAVALSRIPRDQVPDMPDRVIAATALALGLPLVTRDGRIRASGVETIW
jgi:PIN domain nuclease of toxin-antitoxin system